MGVSFAVCLFVRYALPELLLIRSFVLFWSIFFLQTAIDEEHRGTGVRNRRAFCSCQRGLRSRYGKELRLRTGRKSRVCLANVPDPGKEKGWLIFILSFVPFFIFYFWKFLLNFRLSHNCCLLRMQLKQILSYCFLPFLVFACFQ